jgi:hypothetical protein
VRANCLDATGFPTWHLGHFEYFWDGIEVSYCYCTGGRNNFLYKTTNHTCRILRAWQLTVDDDGAVPMRWVVTKFNCVTLCGTF